MATLCKDTAIPPQTIARPRHFIGAHGSRLPPMGKKELALGAMLPVWRVPGLAHRRLMPRFDLGQAIQGKAGDHKDRIKAEPIEERTELPDFDSQAAKDGLRLCHPLR